MSKKFIFQKEQYLELIRNLKNQIEELKSFEELHEKEKLEKKIDDIENKSQKIPLKKDGTPDLRYKINRSN